MVDVSIIIINYNTVELTINAIQSIYNHTSNCNYEIIVVDNNSQEDSTPINERFDNVKLILSPTNLGFAKGNNLGISKAKGEFILLLNSDTLLKNDAISIVLDYLQKHSDVAVASAKLEFPDGKLQHVCQRFPSAKYLAIELFRIQKLWSKQKRGEVLLGAFFDHRTPIFSDWVWGTFFMFRKELLDDFPNTKLHDDFFMYYEDVQWCKEFQERDYKIAYIPKAEVIHFMEGSGGRKNELIAENEMRFLKMYYGWPQRTLILLLTFLLQTSLKWRG